MEEHTPYGAPAETDGVQIAGGLGYVAHGQVAAENAPGTGGWAVTAARVVSAVLHPFLVPVYAIAVYLLVNPVMALAPAKLLFYYGAVTTLGALLIPAFSIGLLRALGIISTLSLQRRQDRTIPLAIVALSYGVCIFMISGLNPLWSFMIRKFFISAFCCSVTALAVTSVWKISLHMVAAGGVTALFVILVVATADNIGLLLPLSLSFLLSGILASARLMLGKHTPAQVGIGFLAGFVITALAMLILS